MNDSQGTQAEALIIAAYRDSERAQEIFESLILIDPDSGAITGMAALVHKDADDKIHYRETEDTKVGEGVGIGALAGAFLGLLIGPAGFATATAAGAVIGGIGARKDVGFDDESLEAIGGALPPGSAAVVATTSAEAVKAIREGTPSSELLSQARDIAMRIQTRLEQGEDLLMTLAVSDDSVSAMEVVSSASELAVFGITVADTPPA